MINTTTQTQHKNQIKTMKKSNSTKLIFSLTTTLLFTILLTFFIFFINTDTSTYLNPSSFFFNTPQSPCTQHLKVYMYDLPRNFNVGMLEHRSGNMGPVKAENLPAWPKNNGLKRQHSVEYWMMASLLYNGGMEVERVFDGEVADVFFVPFFSSLSFNSHGKNMTDPDTEIDRYLQIELLKLLKQSKYWERSGGRDHVIPMTHPNAFRFLRDQVNASIFIVADFGRYPKSLSNLRKDVVAPYVHVVDSFTDDGLPDPFESRKTLLFFQGRTVRKDEGIIRAKMVKILSGLEDVIYAESSATTGSIKASSQGMRSSKFCLHPAGDTPSSCRLFDAIVSHCLPVIVSDRIELPFEDEIDYTGFSIFFSVKEALEPGYMVKQLRDFPKEKWIAMWYQLKNISHHYEFQYPPMKGDAVDMLWRQVRHKLSAAKLAEHRNRRLKITDWWG